MAGAAVWISFLIAGAVAGLQGYSFAKFGARYPSAAGLFEYLYRGFGEGHTTGITAWLTYVTNAIITAMVAVSFGSYASAMFTHGDPTWAKIFAAPQVSTVARSVQRGGGHAGADDADAVQGGLGGDPGLVACHSQAGVGDPVGQVFGIPTARAVYGVDARRKLNV